MNDPNGPYTAKEVAHLDDEQKYELRKEARAFALNSKELLKIIFADEALRKKVVKNEKVREAVKKKLRPKFRRLTVKK